MGKPLREIKVHTTPLQSRLFPGLGLAFPGDIRVHYNKTYRPGQSYSVELRPDLVLETKDGLYIFDAKFKLDRFDENILGDNLGDQTYEGGI